MFPCEICKIFKSIFFLQNTFGGCFYNATETPNKHQNSVSRLIQNLIKFVTKNLFFLPKSYILFINTNRTNWTFKVKIISNSMRMQKDSLFQQCLFTLHWKSKFEYIILRYFTCNYILNAILQDGSFQFKNKLSSSHV